MSDSLKRVFFALDLPKNIQDRISDIILDLNKNDNSVKWVDSANLHVTLHFISDLDSLILGVLKKSMADWKSKGTARMKFGGLNAFPGPERPKIIFLKCEQINGTSIHDLYAKIEKDLKEVGIKIDDRAWTPHITLGRVKNFYKLKSDEYELADETFEIKTFSLIESKLNANGPEYTIVETKNL